MNESTINAINVVIREALPSFEDMRNYNRQNAKALERAAVRFYRENNGSGTNTDYFG